MRWLHHSFPAAWPLIALFSSGWLISEPLHAQPETAEQSAAADAAGSDAVVPITAYRTQVELTEKFSKVFET